MPARSQALSHDGQLSSAQYTEISRLRECASSLKIGIFCAEGVMALCKGVGEAHGKPKVPVCSGQLAEFFKREGALVNGTETGIGGSGGEVL